MALCQNGTECQTGAARLFHRWCRGVVGMTGVSGGPAAAVSCQKTIQGPPADAQQAGGLFFVAFHRFQNRENAFALKRAERSREVEA